MSSQPMEKDIQVTEDEEKVVRTLEEDDEFEDFPVDSKWTGNQDSQINPNSLWEEDWEDDDNGDEFSNKLKAELEKNKK